MAKKKERSYGDDALLYMESHDLYCVDSSCIFCMMKEPNLEKRQALLAKYFKELPQARGREVAFTVRGLWSLAMNQPNKADLVEAGVLESMAALIWRGVRDRRWLLQEDNICVPYYAAHIIGSYTMNREDFAERAVKEGGVVAPLVELLRGRLTWVEQRVAVRALGHVASYDSTFLPVAVQGPDVLELAMELAGASLEIVYTHFVQFEEKRLRYHRALLTKARGGVGHVGAGAGPHVEARKAEEWASQLQCWSLQLINCFAFKEKYLPAICRPSFLTKLPDMWGGLANEDSPAGLGLLRTICQHRLGRSSVAACPGVVLALRRIARSSDDWQYMAVECLLLLLQDSRTRQRVMDMAAGALVDLAELPILIGGSSRRKLGDEIADTLLQDDTQSPSAFLRASLSPDSRRLLDELASQRQRMRWEKDLSKHELLARQQLALDLKLHGNACFGAGDITEAVSKYREAMALCPCKAKKERIVLYSNRAQCHLLLQDAEAAISDTTRALCLARPVNCHGKSLWRRAQAYEMMGLAKESLLDAIMFINECTHAAEKDGGQLLNQPPVPDYAEMLVKKQMREAWLFTEAAIKHGGTTATAALSPSPPPTVVAGAMCGAASSSSNSSVSTAVTTATRITGIVGKSGIAEGRNAQLGEEDAAWEATKGQNSEEEEEEEAGASQAHHYAELDCQSESAFDAASMKSFSTPGGFRKSYTEEHARFTPRSRKFLHSLHQQQQQGDAPRCKPSTNQSPLLPTIREEINKYQSAPGPLDTELLKKSIYDLIQQNLFLDRSNSSDKFSR